MKLEIIEVHLVSLKARLNVTKNYSCNAVLVIETQCLLAQIKALEDERIKEIGKL